MRKIALVMLCMLSTMIVTEKSQAFGVGGVIQYLCISATDGSEIFSGTAHSSAVPRLTAVCESRGGHLLAGFPL